MTLTLTLTVVFGRFRKARSAVSVILECEAREPHTPSPFSLAVFTLAPLRSFVRIWSVARVRKKYDCFAVYCCDRNNILREFFHLHALRDQSLEPKGINKRQ